MITTGRRPFDLLGRRFEIFVSRGAQRYGPIMQKDLGWDVAREHSDVARVSGRVVKKSRDSPEDGDPE